MYFWLLLQIYQVLLDWFVVKGRIFGVNRPTINTSQASMRVKIGFAEYM